MVGLVEDAYPSTTLVESHMVATVGSLLEVDFATEVLRENSVFADERL
jgi:hypothetical protein